MSQPSYLQQIAQRASDRLPILMPPRSPFPRFDSPVAMEILEESPQSESRVVQEKRLSMLPSQTTSPTESLANPLIQSPNKTLEPSPTIDSLNRPELSISTQVEFEPISEVERFEPSQIPANLSRVDQDSPVIAPQSLQPQINGLPDRQPYAIETQHLSLQRTNALTPSITEFNNPLVSQPTQAESLKENSLPIESPPILRWLTPMIQDRNVEMLLPESQRRAISSEVSAAQEHSLKGNTIHIGVIDIQVMPAPVVPEVIAPTRAKSVSTTPLARSFSGSFGLRQG